MVEFEPADFSVDQALTELKSPRVGAVVFFVGVVRGEATRLKQTYAVGAKAELERLEIEAKNRFGVEKTVIIPRQGVLSTGENILLIGVSSARRQKAFRAAEFMIDQMKQSASIQTEELG
jgi:molybdopterin synthase catalytic subunit